MRTDLLVLPPSDVVVICVGREYKSANRRLRLHYPKHNNPPVKLKSPLLPFLACFLSHFSLSSIVYSHALFLSKSSPVSLASCFSPIASACLRLRSNLAKLRALSRAVLVSVMRSRRLALADSDCGVME